MPARMTVRASDPPPQRLIPRAAGLIGDDPIFALNAEASRRIRAGEDIVNSTLGALLDDELCLATIPAVAEAYARIPLERAAGYAPNAGPPAVLEAVRTDVFGDSEFARHCVTVATPGGSGALALAVASFLEHGQALLTSSYFWSPYETIALIQGFHAGDAASCLERLRGFIRAGVRHIVLRFGGGDQATQLERATREILPRLRA